MADAREYFVILREPGSEECWSGHSCVGPAWTAVDNQPWHQRRRAAAHSYLTDILRHNPGSRAIVARVVERRVDGPWTAAWVIRDNQGRYWFGVGRGWKDRKDGAWCASTACDAAQELANLVREGKSARSIESVGVPGETRTEREILPEVEGQAP